MTITATAGTLEAPGATLHYEVRGRGPVLVLLPGGTADAAIFDPVAERLADRFTVVAADQRGYHAAACTSRRGTSASRCSPTTPAG
jgi:pimeloyl-ACP methyl ester carboxylesterase